MPVTPPISRRAFHEFLDALKDIDLDYLSDARGITSEADIAEGQHYLTHLMKVGLEIALDNDENAPHFSSLISPSQKFGGDGPDHYVFFAPINGQREYRIKGRRTGEVYISFTVHTGDHGSLWGTGVVSELNDNYIEFNDDGSYEILLSADEQDGNWMYTDSDTICVITRHYFMNERAAVSDPDVNPVIGIDTITPSNPPLPLSGERFAKKLKTVTGYIKGHTVNRPLQNADTVPNWFSLTPNVLPQPRTWENTDGGGFGAVDAAYAACPFVLSDNEALLIEGVMPECRYANITLWNRYLQTFDHRFRQIGLNLTQLGLGADRRYTIVIAHEDPGHKNWLHTEGRAYGTIYCRFLLAQETIDVPRCTVMQIDQLRSRFKNCPPS
ncbi:MAG: DUF1214 domain-containing protein [Pseudomonadales bacterium]